MSIISPLVKAIAAYHEAKKSKKDFTQERKDLVMALLVVPTYLRKHDVMIEVFEAMGVPKDVLEEIAQ